MGDGWDLITNAADLVKSMERAGYRPSDYSPPDEWTYPCLLFHAHSTPDVGNSWVICKVDTARRLIEACDGASPRWLGRPARGGK